jgi:ABC-type dipeptide/oligopeptide/nickel transport system ATPase component
LQVLDLLVDLQRRTGVAILFITHDFGVVARLAHRVAVMRVGWIVETGRTAEVLNHPAHPYTNALLAAVPGRGELGKAGPNLSPGRHRSGRRGTLPAWPPLQSIGPDHAIVRE